VSPVRLREATAAEPAAAPAAAAEASATGPSESAPGPSVPTVAAAAVGAGAVGVAAGAAAPAAPTTPKPAATGETAVASVGTVVDWVEPVGEWPASPPPPNNVYRVQLDFNPSMEDELGLRTGALVRRSQQQQARQQ
jgi:hypothetical protein